MSAFAFGFKRAFHATLNFARPLFRAFGLTPARYDMLNAIRRLCALECRGCCCLVRQRDLARALGVTAPTVSRMLRSLEALGLVRREPLREDRRQLRVFLTRAGRTRVDHAYGELEIRGALQFAFECVLAPIASSNDEDSLLDGTRLFALDTAEHILRITRYGFADTATHYYPWHPDD